MLEHLTYTFYPCYYLHHITMSPGSLCCTWSESKYSCLPLSARIYSKTSSGKLKPWIILNLLHTLCSPVYKRL